MNRTSSGDSHPRESHDNVAERPASRGEPDNLIKRVEATAAAGLVDADTWKALPYLPEVPSCPSQG